MYIVLLILFIAATDFATSLTVSFSQSTYRINERDGLVQPVLVLSNSSSITIAVEVRDKSITATSE